LIKDLARHPDFGIVFVGATLDEVGDLQPGLVAEVVSASSKKRDYQEKRQDYLEYGIREYWIVDPLLQLTLLIREGEGANATWTERVLQEAETIASSLLPGLAVTVSELWAGV
jgi:Uma2 family endonuclease